MSYYQYEFQYTVSIIKTFIKLRSRSKQCFRFGFFSLYKKFRPSEENYFLQDVINLLSVLFMQYKYFIAQLSIQFYFIKSKRFTKNNTHDCSCVWSWTDRRFTCSITIIRLQIHYIFLRKPFYYLSVAIYPFNFRKMNSPISHANRQIRILSYLCF